MAFPLTLAVIFASYNCSRIEPCERKDQVGFGRATGLVISTGTFAIQNITRRLGFTYTCKM
eukprot:444982-Pyramimonas_sp.AAC.1